MSATTKMNLIRKIDHQTKEDFPILKTTPKGKKLTYLDSGASTQKPKVVIDAIRKFYEEEYANIHRGVYYLSQLSTKRYEDARSTVKNFLNAKSEKEIIFTRGTTESINLVAHGLSLNHLQKDDEILITSMEHHSNIVPWQMICERVGAKLVVADINQKGELILDDFKKKLSRKTKVVGLIHVSNALGSINPIKELIQLAKEKNAITVIDGAQSVAHLPIDVQDLDCDFFAFSGHKIYGPTGIGVLYGKEKVLENLPPYQGGGDMISQVTFEKTTYNELPHRFEAGTPNISGAVGLKAAIDYFSNFSITDIVQHEKELLDYAHQEMAKIDGVKIIGEAKDKLGAISFIVEGIHPHDMGTILDDQGICIRAGHHCAQPVMDFFKIPATTRASLGIYNNKEDIDELITGILNAKKIFGV
jgi:cysteine desulfurase/selenocysteine lyase